MVIVIAIPMPIANIIIAIATSYFASWLYDRRKKH